MASVGDHAGPLALTVYRSLARLSTPAAGLLLDFRQRRGKEDQQRRGERMGLSCKPRPAGPLVWLHAASVGETNAVLPLIARIAAAGPVPLLTSGTVTSAEVAARRLVGPAIHQFVPLDLPRFLDRFLDHWRPDLMILVESELWPGMMQAVAGRGIPLVLVNGRMSDRSFRRWRRARWFARALLSPLRLCLAQTAADAQRFAALGAGHVAVSGNLKFDAPPPEVDEKALAALRAEIGARPVFLAASTHPGEEEAVLEALTRLKVQTPGLLAILAPRHPGRGADIETLARGRKLVTARRAAGQPITAESDIYIADTIGEMGLWYSLASVAFLGGSLVPRGGQNPIEPAKIGVALMHGPHVANFAEVYRALSDAGAVRAVAGPEELGTEAGALLGDVDQRNRLVREARASVERFAGALDRTWEALGPWLPGRAPDD